MSAMRLVGGPNSPFVRKVLIAIIEKGLLDQVELVRVSPPASMMVVNPPLLARNPVGKIPVLETGDLALYESDLICEYLDATFAPATLVPPAGPERWRALLWNALATGGMEMLILWRGERLRPAEQRSPELVATCDAKLRAILAAMDAALPDLAAAPFGLAHIAWGCFLGYLDFRFDDLGWRALWPAGAGWFDTFLARPSSAATLPDSDAKSYPDPATPAAPRLVWR